MKTTKQGSIGALCLLFFFISGACGLVYEVAWLRVLGLIFGNTTFAISTVLAGYMAGLGLGAFYFGRWIERHMAAEPPKRRRYPIFLYGVLEAGIGLYACLTPLLWKLIDYLHIGFYRAFDPSFMTVSIFKFVVAFMVLFIPTFLMGGTLPVMSKFFIRTGEHTGRFLGYLYAVNTFGAVVGVLSSAFFLIYKVGVWQTVLLTAAANLLIFVFCWLIYQRKETGSDEQLYLPQDLSSREKTVDDSEDQALSPFKLRVLLFLFAVSGGVSMLYEVGWTRALALVLGSSTYAFSVMLATFLLGLAAGSSMFGFISRFAKPGLFLFAVLQVFTACFALLGMNLFEEMPYHFVRGLDFFKQNIFYAEGGKFVFYAAVMFPPTFCIGVMFACFIHLVRKNFALGNNIGTAYFANTAGTIAGSILAGFVLIPVIGIRATLVTAACLNMAIAAIVMGLNPARSEWRRLTGSALCAVFFLASLLRAGAWNPLIMTSGLAVRPDEAVNVKNKTEFMKIFKQERILYYKEGTSATISVGKNFDNVFMAVNGKVDASTSDSFTQYLVGHLPMFLHPKPDDVLVVGLGSGSTLAAAASHPVKRIDAVELEAAVVEASAFFKELNRDILKDDRVRMHVNDGRNFLLVTSKEYDVIISEPSNPWMAGVANLFTVEYYELMHSHLKQGGMAVQWLQAYSTSPEDIRMVMKSFTDVFEYTSVWASYFEDLILIGSPEPLDMDMNLIRERFKNPLVRKDLGRYGMIRPEGLFASYFLSDSEARKVGEGSRQNRDNHPYLEYSSPKYLYAETLTDNLKFLFPFRQQIFPAISNLDPPVRENIPFLTEVARGYIGKENFRLANQTLRLAEELDPDHARVLEVRGILYYMEEELEHARKVLTRAVAAEPNSGEAQFYLGASLFELERFEEALGPAKRAFEINPQDDEYAVLLADCYFDLDEKDRAFSMYGKALEINPANYDALKRLVVLSLMSGDIDRRISVLSRMVDSYPEVERHFWQLFNLYEQEEKLLEMAGVLEKLTMHFPDNAKAAYHMGIINERLNRPGQARRFFKKAKRLGYVHEGPEEVTSAG